jgi:uncharacterized repeat protein (TIGR03803 family)
MFHDPSMFRVTVWSGIRAILLLAACGALPAEAKAFDVVHEFCSRAFCADGGDPLGALIADGKGNLYGTTAYGGKLGGNCGNGGCGTVFMIAPGGKEKVLHSFRGGTTDGANPAGGLIASQTGDLYGTTLGGGADEDGTLFEIAPNGSYTLLHSFNGNDGLEPQGSLALDGGGDLYGTSSEGGTGAGNIFEMTPDGTVTSLYAFCKQPGCSDGAVPESAGVVMDGSGDLYGTTSLGGSGASCGAGDGCGVVYELAASGGYSVLYSFCAQTHCADGWSPTGSLVLDMSGALYGTTEVGGSSACEYNGCGTVFSVSQDGAETVLVSFDRSDGFNPIGGVIADKHGDLYGTTFDGGTDGYGTIFEYKPKGGGRMLVSLSRDATYPYAGLLYYKNALYGTTIGGGNTDTLCTWDSGPCGTVFRFKL